MRQKNFDLLSELISDILDQGNASITIKISKKTKEATRDENGNWNIFSEDGKFTTIPTSLTTFPSNRSSTALDLLREMLFRSFLIENGFPETLLTPLFTQNLTAGNLLGEEETSPLPSYLPLPNVPLPNIPIPETPNNPPPMPEILNMLAGSLGSSDLLQNQLAQVNQALGGENTNPVNGLTLEKLRDAFSRIVGPSLK